MVSDDLLKSHPSMLIKVMYIASPWDFLRIVTNGW